ncbi:MAG: DUF1232 domain-containing protein [Dehalococcoidia bacterium]
MPALPDWLWILLTIFLGVLLLLAAVAVWAARQIGVRLLLGRLNRLSLLRRVALVRGLAFDRRVPLLARVIPWLLVGYLVSPIDLIPDFIPVFGQLDDIAIVAFGLWLMLRLIPPELLEEHLRREERTLPLP